MANEIIKSQITHRWYTRPVIFVTDVHLALCFYIDKLSFKKQWHEGDGTGKVCQINRAECEIILARMPHAAIMRACSSS